MSTDGPGKPVKRSQLAYKTRQQKFAEQRGDEAVAAQQSAGTERAEPAATALLERPPGQPTGDRAPEGTRIAPKIVIRDTPRNESGFKRMGWLALIAILGLAVYALVDRTQREDIHYIEALRMVSEYERGKPVEIRNYGNPVYRQALAELGLVDPESISVAAANQRASVLRNQVQRFNDAREQARTRAGERQALDEQRRARIGQARERNRALPVTEYPECDE